MNRFTFEPGDGSLTTYDPPAIVVQAFDEEKALAECRALLEQRDAAKGDYQNSILALGHQFIEVKRALPGVPLPSGTESWSPAFLSFVEKIGITRKTAQQYMRYARNPARLKNAREKMKIRKRVSTQRHKVLKEMLAAYQNGYSPEEIFAAIRKELNEAQ